MTVETMRAATVVVADDTAPILELVAQILGRVAGRVVTARDGRGAWEAIRRHKPEVALLDADMPLLDGLAVTRLIRAEAALSGTRVVLMTAHAGAEELASEAGADHLIAKPFAPAQLVSVVRELLAARPGETPPGPTRAA